MVVELSNDVVEEILERLPVDTLIRFKCVSKKWKSKIESANFQKRQLTYRQQSRDPDVLFLGFSAFSDDIDDDDDDDDDRTIKISSSSVITRVKLPTERRFFSSTSCDGLVCLYNGYEPNIVINPATRWHRTLPPSHFNQPSWLTYQFPKLGFGKDKINGTYKLVWLYNNNNDRHSSYLRRLSYHPTTTCEVFDFNTNSWRYVTPSSPYEIIPCIDTVFVDGSFHWLTKCEETKVLSFDLHTETFQVIAKAPFVYARDPHYEISMHNLNNRLCISERNSPDVQVLWFFDSGRKTLNPMYSTTVIPTLRFMTVLEPLAVLEDKKNNKTNLLFFERCSRRHLMLYDLHHSYRFFSSKKGHAVGNYFQSLFSI